MGTIETFGPVVMHDRVHRRADKGGLEDMGHSIDGMLELNQDNRLTSQPRTGAVKNIRGDKNTGVGMYGSTGGFMGFGADDHPIDTHEPGE